nr:TRAP transporter large permease [Amylibacter sp.]
MSIALILLLVVFIALVLMDAPIAVALGLSSVFYLAIADLAPMIVVAQRAVAGIDSFTLLAIPLFLLAGLLMVHGGLAPRIIALCAAIVGRGTGGLAIVMIAACMLFGSLSGSGVADVVAIGTMMMPSMKDRGYDPGFSAAALGCAGSLGTVIPPSIVLIVYGTATNTSIGALFVGAIIPGVLLGGGLMVVAWWISRKNGWKGGEPFTWPELWRALKDSVFALIAPLIIVGGIRAGFFTPTEAAGIGVAYALFVGVFVYRALSFKRIREILFETTEMTGAILIVIV